MTEKITVISPNQIDTNEIAIKLTAMQFNGLSQAAKANKHVQRILARAVVTNEKGVKMELKRNVILFQGPDPTKQFLVDFFIKAIIPDIVKESVEGMRPRVEELNEDVAEGRI